MTSNHHAPYDLGYTRATMDNTKGSETARSSKSHKVVLSSDCSLQLDYMKLESLVIVDQHATVNTFPGLVHTARHTTRVCNTRSRWSNHLELAVEGGTNDWGEVVVQGSRIGRCGWITSFLRIYSEHLVEMIRNNVTYCIQF